MTDPADENDWRPWAVAPGSGFEVQDPDGRVALVQIDAKRFLVTRPFRFSNPEVQRDLVERLVERGVPDAEAVAAVDDARTFTPSLENPTDLASIPRYMRWFESSYGVHTLAAIIHDDLIVDDPNAGPLGSDTLSDRLFREMMGAAGVPWLKRWIMWAAVALRSRWAAGGLRRLSVVLWLLLSASGIAAFIWSGGTMLFGWQIIADESGLMIYSLVLPFVAAPLWGKQYGAGIVAAVAALWILPAVALAGVGYALYRLLEHGAQTIDLT